MSKVLIVENNQFEGKFLMAQVKKSGFEVSVITKGKKVLQSVRSQRPDIILLDCIMPKKNGFEILEDLKKDKSLKNIPIITLSHLAQPEDIASCKALGVELHLVKSKTSAKDTIDKINYILDRG